MTLSELAGLIRPELMPFLELTLKLGFIPVLVGGAVRDFLMGQKQIHDWDFELHGGTSESYKKLIDQLSVTFDLKPQGHHVYKAFKNKFELQFAPPRREVYVAREIYSHSDFESIVDWSLSFTEAARRRDFTINALGAALDINGAWKLMDPFGGTEHLKEKTLVACDEEHFSKDPVRVLRATRFALKYNFTLSRELKDLCEATDLGFVSSFYISEEARKSKAPFQFWNKLQAYPTLPQKFQGGLLDPRKMDLIYQTHLSDLGHSNAILAAVFSFGEGWHLLLSLAGKGESEATVWRHRRSHLLNLNALDQSKSDEELLNDEVFLSLVRLMRPPHLWLQMKWTQDVLDSFNLSWIYQKPFSDNYEVTDFPAKERAQRKVLAWLRS